MVKAVRVRYAPSPTGEPHLGNIRSALFNWLYARGHAGTFIVRIEDTDQNRMVPGAIDSILGALNWLGLDWDEGPGVGGPYGPYTQSERLSIYKEHADRLIASECAYQCYCSSERLDSMRKDQQARGISPGYDRNCRDENKRAAARVNNPNGVVRFAMPTEGQIAIRDAVRGEVVFDAGLLDDFVILKSDGFPTYHLANVVDDHLMAISHVMRAEEWLPSAPRHHALYQAFGYEMPELVHLPIILGSDRSKLSKRHGATSVLYYRDQGYLPSAVLNFLALLGWSLDDETEIFSRDELSQAFSIDRIIGHAAIFNLEKLDWINGVYMRRMTTESLAEHLTPWLAERGWNPPAAYLQRILPLEKERLKKLSDAPHALEFFFEEPTPEPTLICKASKVEMGEAKWYLQATLESLSQLTDWNQETLEAQLRALCETHGWKTGGVFSAIRVSITGRTAAPPLFSTIDVLGRTLVLARVQRAIEAL